MTTIVVPYHQDSHLPPGIFPLPEHSDYLVLEPELSPGDTWSRVAGVVAATASQVALSVAEGGRTTVLSGDCLLALGTLAGVQRAGLEPALIWLDAHADLHTTRTTTSGYLGGLSLRLALGADRGLLADPLGLHAVPEDRALLVGARDLDPAESDFLEAGGLRQCSVPELTAESVPDGPLLLHVDLDVIDPGDLPGLLFPAPGGPSAAEVLDAVGRVLATGRVVALDLACTWGPTDDGRVRQGRAELLAALIGSGVGGAGVTAPGDARTDSE